MITNCTRGSVFTLWSKLRTVIFLKTCWHSFVPGSCQEQPWPGLCWRPIKKKDPVAVTQQLKTFTQLGPSNPEATLSYCKDLHQGCGRRSVGDGRGPGAPGECRRSEDGTKDNDFELSVIVEFPITCTWRGYLLGYLAYIVKMQRTFHHPGSVDVCWWVSIHFT